MDTELANRIHDIVNEYYDGGHIQQRYCISEIPDTNGKVHQLLHRTDDKGAFYDITDTVYHDTFLSLKLTKDDINKIKKDDSIPKYPTANEYRFIEIFGGDVATKLKDDKLNNRWKFDRKTYQKVKVFSQEDKIRNKFNIDPSQNITIAKLDDGNIKLKIGDTEAVGSKTQFNNFLHNGTVKTFGNISFAAKDGVKASTKKEMDIANAVDDWIKKDDHNPSNPNIDGVLQGDNRSDHFYAVRDGSPTKSDVLVVHDKRGFNPDSKKPKSPDRVFYIEAKLSEKARSFNPSLHIVGNKSNLRFEYKGFFVDNNDDEIKQIDENLTEEEQVQERAKNIIIGDEITNLVEQDPKSMEIMSLLKEILNRYEALNESAGNHYDFPTDFDKFPKIFDRVIDLLIQLRQTKLIRYVMDTFNEKYRGQKKDSIEELKGIGDNQKTTLLVYFVTFKILKKTTLDIFSGEIPRSKLRKLGDLITYWYRDKKDTAYIEIGPNNKNPGGIYIFDKNFDPFNIQEKFPGKIKTFTESIKGASYVIRRLRGKLANGFVANFVLRIDGNGLQFEEILNNKSNALRMEPGDTENDSSEFFNPKG